ncbi:TPA: hypothetical protein DIV45_02215 [Patescibacteria group bacterium]|nr:hypothetical protein [Patescibacteria group bacterium]
MSSQETSANFLRCILGNNFYFLIKNPATKLGKWQGGDIGQKRDAQRRPSGAFRNKICAGIFGGAHNENPNVMYKTREKSTRPGSP